MTLIKKINNMHVVKIGEESKNSNLTPGHAVDNTLAASAQKYGMVQKSIRKIGKPPMDRHAETLVESDKLRIDNSNTLTEYGQDEESNVPAFSLRFPFSTFISIIVFFVCYLQF